MLAFLSPAADAPYSSVRREIRNHADNLDSISVGGAVSRRCFGFVSDKAMRPDNA
jgi:hypothetical protein